MTAVSEFGLIRTEIEIEFAKFAIAAFQES
jgi:hypothetical protein